ncbi:uncharacterized protein A4U43_UnF7450 [Asparagus officinalis]|uniref:R domain-containing protein n=1 Tax=Asparagus officinalis TaxID=4686 RepID=A0A1R3L679_ASPOF|nr:uncharacterized protein A4U43_UnF7450 [Asparagus officinalis]
MVKGLEWLGRGACGWARGGCDGGVRDEAEEGRGGGGGGGGGGESVWLGFSKSLELEFEDISTISDYNGKHLVSEHKKAKPKTKKESSRRAPCLPEIVRELRDMARARARARERTRMKKLGVQDNLLSINE